MPTVRVLAPTWGGTAVGHPAGGGTVVVVGDISGDDEGETGVGPAEDDTQVPGEDDPEASELVEETAGEAPTRFEKVRRSSVGVVMTGIALGLQDALTLPRKEPAFVIKTSGEPDGEPGPIDLQFDPDDPANTVAVIRPWLADSPKPDPPTG
jgi:hypothetical protein